MRVRGWGQEEVIPGWEEEEEQIGQDPGRITLVDRETLGIMTGALEKVTVGKTKPSGTERTELGAAGEGNSEEGGGLSLELKVEPGSFKKDRWKVLRKWCSEPGNPFPPPQASQQKVAGEACPPKGLQAQCVLRRRASSVRARSCKYFRTWGYKLQDFAGKLVFHFSPKGNSEKVSKSGEGWDMVSGLGGGAKKAWKWRCSVVSNSLWPHGL